MAHRQSNEAIDCPTCHEWVAVEVIGSVHVADADFLVSLSQCGKCDTPILFGQEIFPPAELEAPKRLWPDAHPDLPHQVPADLRSTLREAATCYSSGTYVASIIMVRRFIDGLAIELGCPKRMGPAQKIEWMRDNGLIDDRLNEWAHALRLAGNRAAHDTSTSATRQDAEDVLALAEAIANYLFVIKAKFDAFQERQAAR